MWYFDRIPEERRPEIIELAAADNLDALDAIYSEYKVYPAGYCNSCKQKSIIKEWTKYLIAEYWQTTPEPPKASK